MKERTKHKSYLSLSPLREGREAVRNKIHEEQVMDDEHGAAFQRESYLDKFHLAGKVALVTGGSRGIGKAIALCLAEAGADIILASRKLPDLQATAQEISQMGRKALAVPANIRHLTEIDDLLKKSLAEFGHIDILVNNAAANPVFGSVFNIDEKAWEVTIGLNLKSCFFLSQAAGKIMRDKGGGSIINISSVGGVRPGIGMGVYSISKAGLIMLTQVLAQEWGQHNIRVNAIAPGTVRTKFSEALWENPVALKEREDNTALGRIAEPEEMANAALFLASEASSYMTGQTLLIDGGHFSSVRTLLSTIS
jgi:NAD(P)-dependent dehydrogenase (short-subunit alcohol dehydrogenase family)